MKKTYYLHAKKVFSTCRENIFCMDKIIESMGKAIQKSHWLFCEVPADAIAASLSD